MIKSALIIVGPGGVGKGSLAKLIRDDAVSIDPYRLRPDGPRRDSDDPLYAHPKLRVELHSMLSSFGDSCHEIPCKPERMEWFPKSKILFFTVRSIWQCLILHNLTGTIAKAELYAPILPAMLSITEIHDSIGISRVLVLNPASISLTEMSDWKELEEKTKTNCEKRKDPAKSVDERVGTIIDEAPAWRTLIGEQGAYELEKWPFPEYRFMIEDNSQLLQEARRFILRRYPNLEEFFKLEDEL
jgi:hypothetical protein